ncbi:MAG: hypothetical protein ACK4UN_00315 [Limisphaerales bacterium]
MSAVVENVCQIGAVQQGQVKIADEGDIKTRPRIILPGPNREISVFAQEVGREIGKKNVWFCRNGKVVEVGRKLMTSKVESVVIHQLGIQEVRSAIEQFVRLGRWARNGENERIFVAESMNRELAAALLEAPQFKQALPRIDRIVDVPVPVLKDGKLVFIKTGYDERFRTYCPFTGPEIQPMTLQESKECLKDVFKDFCFADELSLTVAIARLMTPMCKGLMEWSARTPVWLFEGNRPRSGKDYLAGCTLVLYEGYANEDAPLDSDSEETRKRLTAALNSGRRFMHFANCRGHIENSVFEQASTTSVFSGRLLGRSDAGADLTMPNEIEFSLSANTGFSFTEDFQLRCRRITLQYTDEHANSRKFSRPDLHGWIQAHRSDLLNSLAGLIVHWNEKGRPRGNTFTSFPKWAEIVGGIMICCGLGDPCSVQQYTLTGDTTEQDMKKLFSAAYEEHPDMIIGKDEVKALVSEGELFSWWDLTTKAHQTSFGRALKGYDRRVLGGIQMVINDQAKRPKFRFTKQIEATKHGIVSDVFKKWEHREHWEPLQELKTDKREICKGLEVPEVPNVPTSHSVIHDCKMAA